MSHAVLSPSSASRWLACTPSARLEQQFPDSAGAAAAEGTLAHSLGELLLSEAIGLIDYIDLAYRVGELNIDPVIVNEMTSHAEGYRDYVLEQYNAAKARTKDAVIFLEAKLDLTEYVPEGYGTGDTVIVADHIMDIIDLKYGKGVPVSAERNKQMMLYALGALADFDFMYDIHTVRMHIYQPRIDNISVFEMSVADLRQWAEDELKPRAKMAFDGEGDFAPGEVCRFCKAKAKCKALANYNLELAKYEFMEVSLLSDAEVADVLTRADMFTQWIKAVSNYALAEAVNNGKTFPGYKLVEGRSNRKYTDENEVLNNLLFGANYKREVITEPASLLPITKLEKAIGKADFAEYVSPYLIKPQGKPTLVPESDKRPAFNSADAAKIDFAELLETQD